MGYTGRIVWALLASSLLTAATAASARPIGIAAVEAVDAGRWGERIDAALAAGDLRPARIQPDADFPGRRHLRYDQQVGGLRVVGGQLVRQVDAAGRTLSVFGRWISAVPRPAPPALDAAAAASAAGAAYGAGAHVVGASELVLLPLESRTALVYALHVRHGIGLARCYVDAADGRIVFAYEDQPSEAATGLGSGVWGDRKKMSVDAEAGTFFARDRLRPFPLTTYDMRFDQAALSAFFDTGVPPDAFVARDADDDWTDGAVVDAHNYAGFTYDYYFKRHGRLGIDGVNLPVRNVTHFAPGLANAFWDPAVAGMFLGDGGAGYVSFGAGLDVVGHELTHGVTTFTWGGDSVGETGALSEAFSDIMGTAVEFFFQPVGNGRLMADYWLGEDVTAIFDPAHNAFRAMDDPSRICRSFGCDPDHYANRYRGNEDNGGVHVNAGIASHAFYLLVEGGTNRTSGRTVAGLGAANRDRAEKIFYRGFTLHLTPAATFADARAATIQAAIELYGVGRESDETAAAWSAVGVD